MGGYGAMGTGGWLQGGQQMGHALVLHSRQQSSGLCDYSAVQISMAACWHECCCTANTPHAGLLQANGRLVDVCCTPLWAVAVAALAGNKTVFRTLTNVKGPATFTASVDQPEHFTIKVVSPGFTSNLGDNQVVTFYITHTPGAPYGTWSDGAITWRSNLGTTTRIPVVLKAAHLASKPAEVRLTSWVPKYIFFVEPEWSGSMITRTTGLYSSKVYKGSVSDAAPSTVAVTLPAGTWSHVRFSLFNDDLPDWHNSLPAGHDLALLVYKGSNLVGMSDNELNSDEEVKVENASGTYTMRIGMAENPVSTTYKLHVWYLNFTAGATNSSSSSIAFKSEPGSSGPVDVAGGLSPRRVALTFSQDLKRASSSQKFLGAVLYYKREAGSSSFEQVESQTLVSLV